jgi:glycosyltransferase involved in cell wall biosynthesis
LKILYFHQHFSTPKGSTGTRSYEFSQALIRAGHQVTMVCGSYWIANSGLKNKFISGMRKGVVDGISVIELELPYSNSDNFFRRTSLFIKFSIAGIKIALTESYDLLFATSTPLTAGVPGIIAKIVKRKYFIFEIRDLWPELPKAMGVISNPFILKAMDILESISYGMADKCIALAPGIAHGVTRKFPHKDVIIIPNGSDEIDLIKSESRTNNFIAAFTGAHGQANGLHAVLDVAVLLKRNNELDIEFQFIGDGRLKPNLMDRAKREKLDNCFFLNPMPKHEMFQYLHNHVDIGLMILDNIPAFYNGTSPNKFFDYLSLGLPILNNYPGWLATLIENHDCGITVPPDDPLAFATALISMKQNPEELKLMGKNSLSLSKEKFSRTMLADKFVKYLTTIQ